MPAGIEETDTMMLGGGLSAWHRLGNVIPEDVVTAAEAIEESGLGWEVVTMPVQAYAPGDPLPIELPEFRAVVRTDIYKGLGVMGAGYRPVQNVEAFEFMDNLVDSGEAKYHTAGSLRGGKQVFLLARVPREIQIGGIESEQIDVFLLLRNSHDGSSGLGVYVTPIRVVCENTLNAAIRGAVSSWSTRHTSGIEGRMHEARKTLELTFRYTDVFEQMGEAMLAEKVGVGRGLDRFLEGLLPYPEDLQVELTRDPSFRPRVKTNIDNDRREIRAIARNEDNLGNVRGTAWATWNAVAQWDDHVRRVRKSKTTSVEERRALRTIDDPQLKSRAMKLLVPEFAATRGENLQILNAA
jgi:phage/plasmid-like protein (TIGR03299 family)